MSGAHHHHHHGPDHAHDHGHGHSHAPASFGRAFAIGIALNSAFVAVEAGYGIASGSMALVADAGHNLSDVLSLAVAWAASVLAARPPSARFTYGYKSSSILAALFNASLLMLALGAILVETVRRLIEPQPIAAGPVMVVAGIGIAINTVTALLFLRGREHDINIRGAYLHMASDAAVSAGVVAAGALIALTGAWWIDPVTSLVIVGVIAWGTLGASQRFAADGAARRPCLGRCAAGRGVPLSPPRRQCGARSPYLADEHDRDRDDCASGNPRRPPGRCVPK